MRINKIFLKKQNSNPPTLILTIIVTIIALAFFLFIYNLDSKELEILVMKFGMFGPILLIIIYILTIVFSPFSIIPYWLINLIVYGFAKTCIYASFGLFFGSTINFYLARVYGYSILDKILTKKNVNKIRKYSKIIDNKMLFFLRIIAGPTNDYLSYASGMTNICYTHFILITLAVSLPLIFFELFLLNRSFNSIWVFSILITFWGISSWILYRFVKKKI